MIFDLYRMITFRSTGGNHIEQQEKYFCSKEYEETDMQGRTDGQVIELNPLSDNNPLLLFQQIISCYKPGDTIKSEGPRTVMIPEGSSVADLIEPLSQEEMWMIASSIADKFRS